MDGLKQRIARAIRGQAQPTQTILSSLLAVEDELGYIPKEAVDEVADFTNSTVNGVWAVASFYPNFRFEPPCRHRMEVCWGASCHITGAREVIQAVFDAAGLQEEGDTPDGKVTVRLNTCLGACAQAPVISLDHHLMGRITPADARTKVAQLLAESGPSEERNP